MSAPIFIHVMTDGDIFVSNNLNDNGTGTLAGTFRVISDAALTKITTISGNSGAYSVSNANGKNGRDLGVR
jgi:hypothetical protein